MKGTDEAEEEEEKEVELDDAAHSVPKVMKTESGIDILYGKIL